MERETLLHELSKFINSSEAFKLMESSTLSRLVAVEGLTETLLSKYGNEVKEDPIKQQIGKYAREVMERHGYRIDRQTVRTRNNRLFSSGTRYIK